MNGLFQVHYLLMIEQHEWFISGTLLINDWATRMLYFRYITYFYKRQIVFYELFVIVCINIILISKNNSVILMYKHVKRKHDIFDL